MRRYQLVLQQRVLAEQQNQQQQHQQQQQHHQQQLQQQQHLLAQQQHAQLQRGAGGLGGVKRPAEAEGSLRTSTRPMLNLLLLLLRASV